MSYSIKLRTETITKNCKLNDTQYCSWLAMNIGNVPVRVYGYTINPGEGLSSKDIVATQPGDLWKEPIEIEVEAGGRLRLARSICTKIVS